MATRNKSKLTQAPSLTNLNNLRSRLTPTVSAGLLALGLVAQPAQAAITFNFNYLNPDQGFDDPIYGSERKAALNDAAATLGSYLSNYSATLTYNVNSYSDNTINTLAFATSPSYLQSGTFQQTWVQSKILNNDTSISTEADGTINWNFAFDWGLGNNVGANQYDFKSTAMHELIHTLGFTSYVNPNGTGLEGNTSGTPDTWSIFDIFLTDANGNSLINNSNGAFNTNLIGALVAGDTNAAGVLFNGPNANAANGGAGIPIYSPNPYEPGSSIDHIDDHSAVTSPMVMNAVHGTGQDVRVLSAIEIGILKDIGYTNVAAPAPVPVPAAAWLMVSGLFGLFGVSRRKAC
jgi:hypothetical protein